MSTYINTRAYPAQRGFAATPGHNWTAHTQRRLVQCYGAARAKQIMSGKDPNTQRDIAAWERLGARARPVSRLSAEAR